MMLVKEIKQKEKEMKNYQLNQLNKQLKKLREKLLILIFEIKKYFIKIFIWEHVKCEMTSN